MPAGVTSVQVTAIGGQGGAGATASFCDTAGGARGLGARVTGALTSLSSGANLFVDVGANGQNGENETVAGGGQFDGGAGGEGILSCSGSGGGGGGSSGVSRQARGDGSGLTGDPSTDPRLIVAAGGGGGGGGGLETCDSALAAGGDGGAAGGSGMGAGNGGAGHDIGPGDPGRAGGIGAGGGAGDQQTGGPCGDGSGDGGSGSATTGGAGGLGCCDGGAGGGGGGGFVGGGAGAGGDFGGGGGGGGGSSYGPAGTSYATALNTDTSSVAISYTATSTSVSAPATGVTGTAIGASSISAALSGATSAASGTITFTVFGPQSSPPASCTSGGTTVGTAGVSGSGTYHPSAGFTPSSTGTYYWYASYSGDGENQPSNSGCGTGMRSTVVSKPPTAATGSAVNVTETSATLTGTVNPNGSATTYSFQYGTSTAYGKQTSTQSAGSGTATHAVSVSISGLSPGTTYHFRIVAKNAGGTSDGADMTFTTPKRPLNLTVSPTRTGAGTRACFAFKASSHGHPVARATVRFANHTARTSHAGKATICLTLHHRTYHPSATKAGYRSARATVRASAATKPKPEPTFTG